MSDERTLTRADLMPKSKRIHIGVKLSPEQYRMLREAADEAGEGPTEYARNAILRRMK